jgi:hypothetical protein
LRPAIRPQPAINQERAAAPTRRDFWKRIRAERRRQALEDAVRQILGVGEELDFLAISLDPDSSFYNSKLTKKKIGQLVEDAAGSLAGIADALTALLDEEAR